MSNVEIVPVGELPPIGVVPKKIARTGHSPGTLRRTENFFPIRSH